MQMIRTAIHQPNFLPWLGYFHKINLVNNFIFLDDVQLSRGKSFTTRTKILINKQESWLNIPVIGKNDLQSIFETQIDNSFNWKKKHLRTFYLNYKKSPHFEETYSLLEEIYFLEFESLAEFNIHSIEKISHFLNQDINFHRSSELSKSKIYDGWDKLLSLIEEIDSDVYLSGTGSGSKRYVNSKELDDRNIKLEWQNYTLNEYEQGIETFIDKLSIIDALFCLGPKKTATLLNK